MNTTEMLAERPPAENGAASESITGLALAPLVDKIAYGIARGLVVAMKELENHIASETRKVSDSVGLRLDSLQYSLQEITQSVTEQRAFNTAIQEKHQNLAHGLDALRTEAAEFTTLISRRVDVAAATLKEADAKQVAELESVRAAAREAAASLAARIDAVCKDLSIQQEDIVAIKSTLSGFATNFEGFAERLDRQADALRSMCAAYTQRETELESLVDGLARLRSYPAPAPAPMERL